MCVFHTVNFNGYVSGSLFRHADCDDSGFSNTDVLGIHTYWSIELRNVNYDMDHLAVMILVTGIYDSYIVFSRGFVYQIDSYSAVYDFSVVCVVSNKDSNVACCIVRQVNFYCTVSFIMDSGIVLDYLEDCFVGG